MVLLLTSGIAMGSGRGEVLQVPWSMLGETIRGRKVVLQLADGETVRGRVSKVTTTSLVVKVKKTSDLVAYPKGETQIPRESVARIEMRRHSPGKRALLGIGAFAGTFALGVYGIFNSEVGTQGAIDAGLIFLGISAAVGAAVHAATGLARVTLEISPDAPGKQDEKAIKGGKRFGAGGGARGC